MSEEVYIDLPPPRCSLPATFSANRIDQIEESLRDLQIQVNTSTAIQMQTGITQYSTPIGVPQKSNDEALIVLLIDKKKEADYLKDKLHKCQIKVENQQIQFSEELDKNHLEAESIRNKLKIMNERFNKLDTEYRQYKNSNIMENEKDLFNGRRSEQDYEAEINTLKDKLNNNKIAFAHTNQVNEDKTKVENQNVELSKQLKNKEAYIGQLKALLLLRTNRNSEGVLGKDDIGSLVSKDTKKSTKDGNRLDVHESMSPSNDKLFCSRYSSSNSSGFTESREHSTLPREREKQTHDHLTNSQSSSASSSNAADPGQTLPPRIQRIIRDSNELGKKLRCISKSIAQVSTNFVDGKDPEFHLLASRFSDSSESEDDCAESNLTKNQLEKLLRKHEEDLSKAEQFLGTLTGNILHFTTCQSREYQQLSCSIQ
uniref:Uncharacterized protein n=1 Tax=Rhabditophanes sp. KR3021 TaxID=114890 RepID=A0AC35UAR1_9BILA